MRSVADGPNLEQLERAIGYRFRSGGRLRHALVHRSAPNERPSEFPESNERLEFLGDAVLDLVIARALFERFGDAAEGALTRYKSTLVSEAALAALARSLSLGAYLALGRGEEDTRGREKSSILSDALEAVLGAIYLDGGMEPVERVILTLFETDLETVRQRSAPRGDYKTALQEWTQAQGMGLPGYRLLDASGPDHCRTYTVAAILAGKELARGTGTSKRDAERLAAENALRALHGDVPGPDA
ncbi:MAG: ribonuclease III [Nitrospirae bacterium]|nr:ribonuclease III [Nitrospirota bacterium]